MTALLLSGVAAIALWIVAEIVGEGIGELVMHVTRYLYSPPRGYFLLPLTWAAFVATWQFILADTPESRPVWLVFAMLGLAYLGLVGLLILRDGLRESQGLPPVRTPARFGPLGRVGLAVAGILLLAPSVLLWSAEGLKDWSKLAGGIFLGGASLYGAIAGRLPVLDLAKLSRKIIGKQGPKKLDPP